MRRVRRWAVAAVAAACAVVLLGLASLWTVSLYRGRVVNARSIDELLTASTGFHSAYRVLSVVAVFAVVAAFGAFIAWLYRARGVLDPTGRRSGFSPGWALYGWLVPGLQLLLPPMFVAQLLDDSRAGGSRGGPVGGWLVAAWWLAGLATVGYAVWPLLVDGDQSYAESPPVLVEASARPTGELVTAALAGVDRSVVVARDPVALALLAVAAALHVLVIVSVSRSAARRAVSEAD